MHVVRIIGLILLSVFIFFQGLFLLTDVKTPVMGGPLLGLVGMGSAVLILISLGARKEKCN